MNLPDRRRLVDLFRRRHQVFAPPSPAELRRAQARARFGSGLAVGIVVGLVALLVRGLRRGPPTR